MGHRYNEPHRELPPGTRHTVASDYLEDLESAPDPFAELTNLDTTTAAAEGEVKRKEYFSYHEQHTLVDTPPGNSSKDRGSSGDDDDREDDDDATESDGDKDGILEALPLTVSDERQITLRRRQVEQRKKAAEEEAKLRARDLRQRENYAKRCEEARIRKRQRLGQVRSWIQNQLLAPVLPAWFTEETSIETGEGKGWKGVAQLRRTWRVIRRAVVLAVATVVFAFLAWWFILPSLFGLLWGSSFDQAGFEATRIDGAGQLIRAPLPLCDLLYDRHAYAREQDDLSLRVSDKAAAEIRAWWRATAPPTKALDPEQPAGGEEATGDAFVTRLPDYHNTPLWKELCRDKVMRVGWEHHAAFTATSSVGCAPASERFVHPKTWKLTSAKHTKGFFKATKAWVQRLCRRGGAGSADSFAVVAKRYGALQLPVTGYLPPNEAPVAPTNTEDVSSSSSVEERVFVEDRLDAYPEDRLPPKNTLMEQIVDLDDDDEVREEEPPPPMDSQDDQDTVDAKAPSADRGRETVTAAVEEQAQKVLAIAPPSPEVYRNVSVFDLHVLLWHLASQGRDTQVETQTASILEHQLGHRVASLAQAFASPVLASDPPPAAPAMDPWEPIVLDELGRLGQAQTPELLRLRTAALWSGPGSCVCPHHVGVPIPGAAWYEVPSEIGTKPQRKGRPRVLFYPTSDAVRAQQAGSGSGGITRIFSTLFSAARSSSPDSGNKLPRTPDTEGAKPVSWLAIDPVVAGKGPDDGASPPSPPVLQLPDSAVRQPWTWVEGLDYRGDRRRLRVSPRSLACIISCTTACGSGGNER